MKMMRFDECNGNDFNGFHRKSFFYCINKRIMDIFGGLFWLDSQYNSNYLFGSSN